MAQTDDIDLGFFVPVFADLGCGGDAFARVERGQGFAAQTLEGVAEEGVEFGADDFLDGAFRAELRDLAEVRKHESKPEAQQRVFERITHLSRGGRRAGERITALHVAQRHQRGEVEVERTIADAGGL